MEKVINIQEFYGGQSSDDVLGPKASFSYVKAMEFRRNPSQLSVLPGMRKISEGIVTDLILNITQVNSGDRYAYGKTGKLYKIDTGNVMTSVPSALESGSDGLLYRSDSDALYMATNKTVERYAPISGVPSFDQTYGASKSIDPGAYSTGGTETYSLPTSIDETKSRLFTSDIEPFHSIKIKVVSKGTGDWTLTLHDGLDTEMSSVTLENSELTNGELAEFVFPEQVRAYVKPNARTYHFHLTSSDGTGTVQTAADEDLSTADFELWADRLVETVNGLHPMAQFLQYTLIGNGNYLAVWEPLSPADPPNNEFQRHRLTFPTGYEVCGIAATDEFAIIACEKRSTDDSRDFQDGKLFLWDGTAQTYNRIINVSGGSPDSLFSYNNYPYFYVNGSLCAWLGGKNIVQIRPMANVNSDFRDSPDDTRVYPNMMTVRDNILHMGFPSTTSNTAIEYGIYTWGTVNKDYPSSFGYGYLMSNEKNLNTEGTLEIGCVQNFGDEMYMSWRDGDSYGLDLVDSYSDPAPSFGFRARRFDAGAARKKKKALRMAIDAEPLPEGVTITPVCKINSDDDRTFETLTSGDEEKIVTINGDNNFKRITIGFDGECDGATESPVIYCNSLLWDPLQNERMM